MIYLVNAGYRQAGPKILSDRWSRRVAAAWSTSRTWFSKGGYGIQLLNPEVPLRCVYIQIYSLKRFNKHGIYNTRAVSRSKPPLPSVQPSKSWKTKVKSRPKRYGWNSVWLAAMMVDCLTANPPYNWSAVRPWLMSFAPQPS